MFDNHNSLFNWPNVIMYNITFSINIEVCGQFIYAFCYFRYLEISINCGLGLFFDVNCVKCKKVYGIMLHFSQVTH